MTISKPSKTAKKREFLALQTLGEELIGLTVEQLGRIGLDDDLLDAVITAKSINSHGALRRQKQLIGKLMRQIDPQPIRESLSSLGKNDRLQKDIFRNAERWRDRIVAEGPAGLAAIHDELGIETRNLTEISNSLMTAPNDRIRRALQRKLFREIHENLAVKMQDNTN